MKKITSYTEVSLDLIIEKLENYKMMGYSYNSIAKRFDIPRKTMWYMQKKYKEGGKYTVSKEIRVKSIDMINALDKEIEQKVKKLGL